MGLHVTLPYPEMYRDDREEEDVDVILHTLNGGEDSLEIPGIDWDEAQSAAVLGFDDFDPELSLYLAYIRGGLNVFIGEYPQELYAAFQKQGYDVFDDENYNADEFLNTVGQNLREYSGPIEEYIEVLDEAVARNEYDKDEFIEDLIEGLKTFVDPDESHWTEGGHEGNELLFMRPLLELLPRKKFSFKHNKPWDEYTEIDERTWYVSHYITINNEYIIEWGQSFDIRIIDEKTFEESGPLDRCTHYDSPETYCPPPAATAIMRIMGWSYPPLPDLAGPDHPESDDDGLFGVEYVKPLYQYSRFEGTSSVSKIPTGKVARTFVRYETLEKAEEAAELSQDLMKNRGILGNYIITVLGYDEDADGWYPAGYWEQSPEED